MLYLFAPYASEAAILAFALAFPVALIVTRLPLGLLYIRDLAALRASQRSGGTAARRRVKPPTPRSERTRSRAGADPEIARSSG